MISEKIIHILADEKRPKNQIELDQEINIARKKGYKIPSIDLTNIVIAQEQAIKSLEKLRIDANSDFYQIMKDFRGFPIGQGSELNSLDQIVSFLENGFWDDEYPNFSEKYLQLSSAEGEGSYFFDRKSGEIYDVGWGDMDHFYEGKIEAKWKNFTEFLEWYYTDFNIY
jgi:hypothetical protein